MAQMLLDGELDAAVVGDKLPDPRLKMLIPDVETAAKVGLPSTATRSTTCWLSVANYRRRGPMWCARCRIFKESRDIAIRAGNKNAAKFHYGVEANRQALESVIDITYRQKLIPRRYTVDELFDDTTRVLV